MTTVVTVATVREALGWRHALVVLACERMAQLFGALGLPAAIVAAPGALLDGAQEFWRRDAELARAVAQERAPTGPEERRLGTVMVLNGALSGLAVAYPEPALEELVGWAHRYYVDEARNAELFIWGQVLLAAVLRSASASLPAADRSAFDDAVTGRIGTGPEAADKAAVKKLEATPPSETESKLAEREPELYGLAWEGIRETLRNQRTWDALAALMPRLADRDGFLAWARVQATIAGIPSEQVRDPR